MTRFQGLRAVFVSLVAPVAIATTMAALSFAPANAAGVGKLYFEGPLQASAPNGIDIMSFTLGAPVQTAGASGAGARPSPSSLQITKSTDSASPNLFRASVTGQHIITMRLVVGGRTLTFKDVLISSYRVTGGSNRENPTEYITFSFLGMNDTANPPPTERTLNAPVLVIPASPTPSPARAAEPR
jgi:hypothetical protein